MGTFYTQQQPLTFEEKQKRGLEYAKTYGKFQPITDTWDGIQEESLWVMGIQELSEEILDKNNFQPDENYNFKTDPQLKGYDAIIDQFMFSNSAMETTHLLEEMKHNALIQKESPFYFLGRLIGAVTDPTTYLAWQFKAARSAIAFGSALTIEEIVKQNIDPFRADEILPMVSTAGFVIPAVLNKFTSNIPSKVADDAVALDQQWNKSATPKITTKLDDTGTTKIYEDGVLVDANKLDAPPSSVGSAGQDIYYQGTGGGFMKKKFKSLAGDTGGDDAAFGAGIYLTKDFKVAQSYGKNVDAYTIDIKKPYKITTDQDIVELFKKAGIKNPELSLQETWIKYMENLKKTNPEAYKKHPMNLKISPKEYLTKYQTPAFKQARKWLEDSGYDSLKVEIKQGGTSSIKRRFGDDQTIIFDSKKVTKKSHPPSTPGKRMEGEQFVKSNLRIFGEDGPWTPVFRVVKSSSLLAKTIMGDLLDTPLLKIKNTKSHNWTASTGSIETKMRVMRVEELEAHMLVKNKYLEYVIRVQGENAAPKLNITMAFHNKFNEKFMSLDEFSREVSKARILKRHDIKEVDSAARIYGEKVYDKLWKEIEELGIREMPVVKELALWTGTLKKMRKNKEGSTTFTNPSDKSKHTYSITQIEATIDDLTKLLARIKSGSKVDNYINRVYLKDAIDANPVRFREIIIANNRRQNITMNKKALDQLLEDLTHYFPFKRFEKTPWKQWLDEWEAFGKGGVKGLDDFLAHKRFIFNKDRYARSLRARALNLDAKAQIELLEDGFIMGDIFGLAKAYARQMIPDILLARKYGDPNGKGYAYVSELESMTSPGLLSVANEYALKLIGKKGAERIKLIKERNQVLSDLEASVELIRGTYGLPKDPHAWHSVALRTMKHYNTLTMLTGFLAAVPDVARVVMTSGIKRGFRTQFSLLDDYLGDGTLFKLGKQEARSAGEAWDLITGQRAMLMGDIGDMFGIANKLERGTGKLAHFNFMYVNMMSRWTEFAKSLASVTIGSRILEDSIKWGKGTLTDKWKTALATSGIDEQIAKRIAVQFEKHGTKTKHNFMANTAEWTDDLARSSFRDALNKDINITVVTPGLGDTPKWMSTEYGSVFAQFKKFAMGATQRMLLRGMQEKDMDFLFGAMLLLGSGMFIDAVYHKYRFNRDYSKVPFTQKLLNAFDRSGLAGIYTDLNRALETLTDNRIGIAPFLGAAKPYGSSMRWKLGTLGGPTGGQLYNIADILFDVFGNKYNHHSAKNVRRLIPFQNVWYLDWLFDDLQKGLRFK